MKDANSLYLKLILKRLFSREKEKWKYRKITIRMKPKANGISIGKKIKSSIQK